MASAPQPFRADGESRPRLVVVYGHRSLDAMQIREGARDWCDLVWLIDAGDPSAAALAPLLRRSGPVVDALGESPQRAAQALARHAPDGLATFYDSNMEHVAAIAAELGLRFHSRETARALEDKLFQREALRAAGLPTPAAVAIPAGSEAGTVQRLGASIGYPAVLKPRRASGSWHTFPIADGGALADRWAELAGGDPEEMLLEEYLSDGPPMPGGFEADYVSIESVVAPDAITHLAITGRLPTVSPFRETGFFIPATIPADRQAELLDLAGQALRGVGFVVGAAHTEIKLTADGPRVIEINGRIGGGVPEMLRLAAGADMMRATMRAALGLAPGVAPLPVCQGVAWRFFFQPPTSARRLESIEGLDELRRRPGIDSVYLHHPPGTEIDARDGTRAYLFAVVGLADDHAGVVAADAFLQTGITARYTPDVENTGGVTATR